MSIPMIKKRAIIQRIGRQLIVEVAEDETILLHTHIEGKKVLGIRLQRDSLLAMLTCLKRIDDEEDAPDGMCLEISFDFP